MAKRERSNRKLNNFNHQTNVDVDNRFAVYGIRDLGAELSVSEAQLCFVSNTQSGMGLMKCGNVVIAFDNTIGKSKNAVDNG